MSDTTTRAADVDIAAGTLRGRPFRLARGGLMPLLSALVGLRVEGLDHVPATGPLLIVGNHLHNGDPLLLAVACPRPIHFMAKRELFAVPLLSNFIRRVGTFPVDRGTADRAAIRHAEAVLAAGIAVGMFPEGTRSATGTMAHAHPGVGLIALRTGAPVLPVAIVGSERLPGNGTKTRRPDASSPTSRRGATIRFGAPFTIPRERAGHRVSAGEATATIMIVIARLLPAGYRGHYANAAADPTSPAGAPSPSHHPSSSNAEEPPSPSRWERGVGR